MQSDGFTVDGEGYVPPPYELADGSWFTPQRTDYFLQWPKLRDLKNQDSVEAGIRCAHALHEALFFEDSEQLWVDPHQASRYTGFHYRVVESRAAAELKGKIGAWPWTRIKPGPLVYLPELWEQMQWVRVVDARRYLDLNPYRFKRASLRGFIKREWRPWWDPNYYALSGTDGAELTACKLLDVVRYKQLMSLRKLFGQPWSYENLELMTDLEPELVARIKVGKLLNHLGYPRERFERHKERRRNPG